MGQICEGGAWAVGNCERMKGRAPWRGSPRHEGERFRGEKAAISLGAEVQPRKPEPSGEVKSQQLPGAVLIEPGEQGWG